MKKFTIYTLAPALALLALGCSSPTAMQSTEYDDMYYSSSDKTTYVEPEANTYDGLTETNNQSQRQASSESSNAVTDNYYADEYEYYDGREYNPRDNWYRPNYSYVDPYWGSAYTPRHYAYSRYNSPFYDPFYDPFYYDPFFYDPFYRRPYWNSGVSVIISYNYGWGNNWGRHYPYYSRWYPHNPHYHHGYYGNNWYGNNWVYDSPIIVNRIKTQYGPRDARGGVVTDGNRGNGGRPVRGEAYQGDVVGTENARPARPSRSSEAIVSPEAGETKTSLPARPSRTEYYDPSQGRSRGTRQPVNVGEQRQQQNERRVIQPSERRTREYTPTRRSTESRSRTREYNVPQQRQRSTESRPSYEPRRESPQPSRSSEVRRESSSSNSSSGSNNSGSSGRPKRGQ